VNQGSVATNSALAGLPAAGLTPDQALGTINRLAATSRPAGAGGADAAAGAHMLAALFSFAITTLASIGFQANCIYP
jgi:hypothetical protein